jgi:hypothetical protein
VVPKNISGRISIWLLTVLVLLIVFASVSIYRVVDLHAKVRVMLEESSTQSSKTTGPYSRQSKVSQVTPVLSKKSVSFETVAMAENGADGILADRKLDEKQLQIESTATISETTVSAMVGSAEQQLDDRLHAAAGQEISVTSSPANMKTESPSPDLESEGKAMSTTGRRDDIEILPVSGKTDPDQKKEVDSAKPEIKSKEDQKTLYVNVPVGRIRQEASLDAKITSRLYKGERVIVEESSMDWYRIDAEDGRKGWAHRELFSKDAPPSVKRSKPLIKAIWVEECTEEKGKIFIELDGYHLPKILVLEGGRPRVACDFHGIEADPALQKTMAVYTGIVQSIRLGVHGEGKAKTRVVVDLLPQNNYIVEQQYFIEKDIYLLEIHSK